MLILDVFYHFLLVINSFEILARKNISVLMTCNEIYNPLCGTYHRLTYSTLYVPATHEACIIFNLRDEKKILSRENKQIKFRVQICFGYHSNLEIASQEANDVFIPHDFWQSWFPILRRRRWKLNTIIAVSLFNRPLQADPLHCSRGDSGQWLLMMTGAPSCGLLLRREEIERIVELYFLLCCLRSCRRSYMIAPQDRLLI